MKSTIVARALSFLLFGFFLAAASVSAQSVAYRQTNLASDSALLVPAAQLNPVLQNTWGMAFLPGGSFFMADPGNGHVSALDATGTSTSPGSFITPSPIGTANDVPVGIVADASSTFGGRDFVQPFIVATRNGNLFVWGHDANGDFLTSATLAFAKNRSGAVYTGIAILKPACCAPMLAVANFHTGSIETYDTQFAPLNALNTFVDPRLPPGFAPFGMQVIGNQLFVTFALQDADKQNPVPGAGNGIVSVFDLQGNFVRRMATAGTLNAPWGITQASANFGPFSNDILIGNTGDGTVSAFDPNTGNFLGQIKDGAGNLIVNDGLHALAFRSDRFGDPDTLYFTAGIGNGQDGLFGAISTGLMSVTRVSAQTTPSGGPVPVTITVSAGPGNTGTPTGQVVVQDGGASIAKLSLEDGMIVFPVILDGVGNHEIEAQYLGDGTFLGSSSFTDVQVALFPTRLTLAAPANAVPGATLILTATTASSDGIPTGQIIFLDGNTNLGSAPLDGTGVAVLRINTLAAGPHTLTASYSGDDKFGVSTSAPVTTTIVARDFSLSAAPPTATVTAGQSTVFSLTVTPAGGFADAVTFSCPAETGITCVFNPPTVTPSGAAVSTMLTVTTSAGVTRYGHAVGMMGSGGSGILLASLGLVMALAMLQNGVRRPHGVFVRVAASAFMVLTLALTLVSCGGYTTSGQTNRGTASITVTAQSGAISHTTAVSVTVQ
jgi:uncharacterized protein (TIGR03118 family)